ncbi:Mpi [Symbiodinium natans]|uniref:mannose-6-phosphate isomerase n=1 Tax=Symbiodinium natans TaxID=878477 RepID=A0A812USR2_9DINO|nr:Mpi [Symbiodinium natans]
MTKRVVVASGYFNPLHYGHVSYLEKARDLGTSLIVIVNNDVQAALRRSKRAQAEDMTLPARERVKLVRSLQCVDAAVEAVDLDDSVAETLQLLHPDIFANGGGRAPAQQEVQVCQKLRIQMVDGLGIQLLSLAPYTQHYDWGKPRNESIIAALTGQQSPHLTDEPDAQKPFAEMWMGDHPSGPARVVSPGSSPRHDRVVHRSTSLQDVFHKTPSVLGPALQDAKQLPFLLKVLSIHKALSIQAHPDRDLASRLHRERPDIYKDPNHKPEIAIALTDDFQALCGFREVSEIVQILEYLPEAVAIVGPDSLESLKAAIGDQQAESIALKNAYTRLMHAPEQDVAEQLKLLHARAQQPSPAAPPNIKELCELVCTLHAQYENDIGIFAALLMNYARLKVGECLYMAQNVPHAYIAGDIVECMACSDNVVRGGLTPKFKDVEVLCAMLRYEGGPPATVKPTVLDKGIKLYADPDIEEFQVMHLHLEAGGRQHRLFSSEGPAMALNLKGAGTVTISGETRDVTPGKVFMFAAGVEPEIHAKTEMDVFVACCPPQYFQTPHASPAHK